MTGTMTEFKFLKIIKRGEEPLPDVERYLMEWVAKKVYPGGVWCATCRRLTNHHLMRSRQAWACSDCGSQRFILAETMFRDSPTPLTVWFAAIDLRLAGSTISDVWRDLGCTYKTAWRMCQIIDNATTGDPGQPIDFTKQWVWERQRG